VYGRGAASVVLAPAGAPYAARAVIRVLVVDDHPVLRAGLEAVLRAEPGFVCVGTAADGDGLVTMVARHRPDVVVLDLVLGDEDGMELCAALRSEPSAPEVVIYTATTAAGLDAVVEKGADLDHFFDALRLAARAARPLA
jgi:DNA-binding NarL/FixJ family response regulator